MATLLRRRLTADSATVDATSATAAADGSVDAIVKLRDVRRTFDRRRVLHGLDLDIAPGEFVALLGASGSGKSTLLRIIAGLDAESTGRISVPQRRAVVYQEHRLLPWKRVWRNVALGLSNAGRRAAAMAALEEVGLAGRADAWPLTLSGGEAQRAALACALVRRPDLLLLDEPFASLDALTRRKVQALVGQLWDEHRPAVFLVTHDVDEAISLADRVLLLDRGRLAFHATVDIDRPRDPGSAEFAALRRDLLGRLGVDTAVPARQSPQPASFHAAAPRPTTPRPTALIRRTP